MTQVIRIEHFDGIGMFRSMNNTRDHSLYHQHYDISNPIASEIWDRHSNFNIPYEDGLDIDSNTKDWFCGYKSIGQLQQWIMQDEFQYLFDLGYKVFLLDVTEYQIGRDQIIYTKESILNKKDISSLF